MIIIKNKNEIHITEIEQKKPPQKPPPRFQPSALLRILDCPAYAHLPETRPSSAGEEGREIHQKAYDFIKAYLLSPFHKLSPAQIFELEGQKETMEYCDYILDKINTIENGIFFIEQLMSSPNYRGIVDFAYIDIDKKIISICDLKTGHLMQYPNYSYFTEIKRWHLVMGECRIDLNLQLMAYLHLFANHPFIIQHTLYSPISDSFNYTIKIAIHQNGKLNEIEIVKDEYENFTKVLNKIFSSKKKKYRPDIRKCGYCYKRTVCPAYTKLTETTYKEVVR